MSDILECLSGILDSQRPSEEVAHVAADRFEEDGLHHWAACLRSPRWRMMTLNVICWLLTIRGDGSWETDLSVEVSGQVEWPGSVGFSINGELIDQVWLPEAEFAVVMILARAADGARGNCIAAYRTSQELASRLAAEGILEIADAQRVISTVFRLRQRLGQLPIACLLARAGLIDRPAAFAMHLIERHHLLGYRLNVREGNLRITELLPRR